MKDPSESRSIDWTSVRARLESSESTSVEPAAVNRVSLEGLFRRRAEVLARRGEEDRESLQALDVLIFRLGEERFGVELVELREVLRLPRLTPVPAARPEILGVINLRGEIRPVVHLGRLLEVPTGDRVSEVLLVQRGAIEVLLAVLETETVRSVAAREMKSLAEEDSALPANYIKSLLPGMLPLLSVDSILSHPLFKEATDL